MSRTQPRQACTGGPGATALYAFSADPITYGHINVVERVSRTFERVIVGIGRNPAKKYLFSLDQRLQLARQALGHLPNVTVLPFHGMVVDFASEQGARVIVKGVRNAADFDYEQVHHLVGLSQRAGIDTHVLFADPALAHVSSSMVKAVQMEHGFIHDYVPLVVKAALEARLSGQLIVGVTGVAAAGKSTLCRQLVAAGERRQLAVHDIDLDTLAHAIFADLGSSLHRETCTALIERFGRGIENAGKVDRKRLAAAVFGDDDALAELNRIMAWPLTVGLRKALYGRRGLILLNGALLAEAKLLPLCNNRVVLVEAPASTQQVRLAARGHSAPDAAARNAAQWSGEQKRDAIAAAIERDRFGNLWSWDGSVGAADDRVDRLLDDIIGRTGCRCLEDEHAHAA